MPVARDLSSVLTAAEAAAAGGDYPSAAEQLREAAAIQEAKLGPDHPDLADTLNNLGVACEKAQRLDDAERHYRRALAIAIKAFPAGHEAVATSRTNLKEFCEANGRPLEPPAPRPPAPRPAVRPVPTATAAPAPGPAPKRTPAPTSVLAAPRPPSRQAPASRAPGFPVRGVAIAAALVGGLLLVVVVASRPWAQSTSAPDAAVAPTPAPPSAPPVATPASTTPATGRADRPAAPKAPLRPAATPGLPVVVNAGLCRNITTGDVNWSCDRAASPVTAGSLVFYTRIRSTRDATVQHRWYRGRELVQSVDLRIRTNLGPGYRTYSRFPVTPGDEWRAELRASDGTVLHEERFVVR